MPKYIVVILDNDLIEYLEYTGPNEGTSYGEWIEHLVEIFNDNFKKCKKLLPSKAVREDYPWTYWVTLPHHKYFRDSESRSVFNKSLESVIKTQPNMRLIRMKEIWNYNNRNLVDKPTGHISFEGLSTYWCSIDAAVKYNVRKHEQFTSKKGGSSAAANEVTATTSHNSNQQEKKFKDPLPQFFKRRNDKYHWSAKRYPSSSYPNGRKLPTPSRKY